MVVQSGDDETEDSIISPASSSLRHMSLATAQPFQHSCSGDAAAFGSLSEVVDRIEDFLRQTLPAILGKLSGRTNGRRRNEKIMAADLSKELNFAATDELFYFHSEDPENESATRTLDYGTYPNARLRVQGWMPNAKERLYGIEAKRLPTHSTPMEGREREREYVVGDWEGRHSPAKNLKGGIERFKEGVHGEGLDRAGMVAFIQREDSNHWLQKVNEWIHDLILNPLPSHKAKWEEQDKLIPCPAPGQGVTEFGSTHARANGSLLGLRHFWLDLRLV